MDTTTINHEDVIYWRNGVDTSIEAIKSYFEVCTLFSHSIWVNIIHWEWTIWNNSITCVASFIFLSIPYWAMKAVNVVQFMCVQLLNIWSYYCHAQLWSILLSIDSNTYYCFFLNTCYAIDLGISNISHVRQLKKWITQQAFSC